MAKNRKLKLDMTGVESYTRCPEGTWRAVVKKVDMTEIQGSGDDGIKAQLECLNGKAKGCSVFETFSLSEKALWKLKSFLEAIGMKADGKLVLDLDKIEGKICEIDVIHDEYNGTKRAKVSAYNKPSDEDVDDDDINDEEDDDDEEEEEQPKKAKKAPAKSKKRPEPDDDDDEDEEEDEKPAKKSKKVASKPAKKSKKQPETEEDDDDDWEDDDD